MSDGSPEAVWHQGEVEAGLPQQERVDNTAYAAMMRRMVKAHGRRAGYDIEALTDLAEISDLLKATIVDAVHQLRSDEGGAYSWAEIGQRLGISAQAAQQRFGGEGHRKPGGQPANLRYLTVVSPGDG